ncbi:MAG: C1 family peptidase [Omnitrophica WOR_2 bacterium]
MPDIHLSTLQSRLKKANARWTARPNQLFGISDNQKRFLLGVVVDQPALKAAMAPHLLAMAAPANYQPEIDWRNRNGNNYVSNIENQAYCGSCVSFASAALVDSMALIEKGVPTDVSEADLHFCSSHGANCNGWWPNNALDELCNRGVVNEAGSPYMSSFDAPPQTDPSNGLWLPHCHPSPDLQTRPIKITQWTTLANVVDRKNYLSNNAPCIGILHVFADFYSYGSGVYHHVTGNDMGLHCVEIIGYSESEGCWICKNSWGAGWGMAGFFKIAYGEAGLDSEFPFWTASGVILPPDIIWHGWEDLGGVIIGPPAVASWSQNRLDCFARGTDNHMYHKWWDGNQWHAWENLGGALASSPAVASWGPNRLDCFARGTDNHMWHMWWDGKKWNGWENLGGGLTSAPAVAAYGPNRLDCFVKGGENHLWHKCWDGAQWRDWEDLGGTITSAPAVAARAAQILDIFALGEKNQLVHMGGDGDSHWTADWEDLGGEWYSAPAVASWGIDRMDIFAANPDNHLLHMPWVNGQWEAWEDLGGLILEAPGTAAWGPNRLDVFTTGADNHMWHKWYG